VQTVLIQGQTAPFAQLAFGRPAPTEPVFFTTVLPINVSFPSTVKIALDDKDKQPVELNWTRCLPGGCFASIATKDDVLKRWRAHEDAGRFTLKNSAGQDVTIPFSLRGLGRALDALAKEG
jgi:invasion protein IalB